MLPRLSSSTHGPSFRHGSAKRGARLSSHPARHDHRDIEHPDSDSSVPDPQELGRADSNLTVAVTLGVGIGLIVFLLALPYLGWA